MKNNETGWPRHDNDATFEKAEREQTKRRCQKLGLFPNPSANGFAVFHNQQLRCNKPRQKGRQNVPKRIDWAYGTKGHGRCKRRHGDGLMLTGPVASAWLCTFLLLSNCKCSLRQEDIRKAVAVFFRAAAAVADWVQWAGKVLSISYRALVAAGSCQTRSNRKL